MQINETNDKFYNLSVNSILSYDSVLFARLIVKAFRKVGYSVKYEKSWNNDLSTAHGKEGSYALKNWIGDSLNRGVSFNIKDDSEDEWEKGEIQISIESGYAYVTILHYNMEGYKKYKFGTSLTVKEFIQKILEKYELIKNRQFSDNQSESGGLIEPLVRLFWKNGFKAEWKKEKYLVVFSDELKNILDEKTLRFYYNNSSFTNFIFPESVEKFKKLARYFIKRMSSIQYALDPLKSEINSYSSTAIILNFKKAEKQQEIEKGFEFLESKLEKLKPVHYSYESFCKHKFIPIIKQLFEDESKREKIINSLEHI